MLSDEWNSYYYEKESGSAVQSKEKNVEKVGTCFEWCTFIATEITKDDVKNIQDEKDVQMEVPNAATEKIEKSCSGC